MKRTNQDVTTTVVEETSLETVEYGTQPVLKLKRPRRTQLDASKRLAFEVSRYCTQQEIVQILVDLDKELPLESLEETEFVIRTLWERLYETKDSVVRVKIVYLLGRAAKYPGVNVHSVVEELIELLPLIESHKETAEIFHTLMVLGKLCDREGKIVHQIEKTAAQHLKDSHFLVRCQCLRLIGHLSQESGSLCLKAGRGREGGVQGLLASFVGDSDPRVRTSVLQALLTLHDHGQTLDIAVYDQASKALDDDYEDVRLVAVKLIWVFSHLMPERTVRLPSSDEVRLVDDAFIKICHMVNDLAMNVRKEATGMLGSLHHVSPKFLEQTLDKKLMSHLKRRKTDHEKRKDKHAAGGTDEGWSTGRTWGDKAPDIEIDPEDVSIISSGTCGAFVHGLEDEFMEVRTAAVDSLCELANRNPPFAVLSLDFLADMMNDEIEAVRVNAINSLRKISRHIQLREDQLETLLSVLEDFSGDTREAVRELLCHCVLSTRACLHAAIHALLGNLAKYPQDKSSIWRCAKFLGEKHQHLASSLVPELLSTHPFFATPEPSIDDPAYVTILILVYNATAKSVTMLAMFPNHTYRHYGYLRDSQPDLVPHLDVEKTAMLHFDDSKTSDEEDSQNARCFLERIRERIQRVLSQKSLIAQQALKTAIQDLQHVKSIDSELSAIAECLSLYVQCQLKILTAQNDSLWDKPAALCTHQGSNMKSLVENVLTVSYQIEHSFVGLSSQHIFLLQQLRLVAHALQILATQSYTTTNERSLNSMLQVWESFLARIKNFSNFLNSQNINTDAFCVAIVSFPSFFESNITNPSRVAEYIESIVMPHKVAPLELTDHLSQASAVLNEPRGGSDNPLCFSAGLTLGINVEAELENVADLTKTRVQVVFPDLRRQWFVPRGDDFHELSAAKQRLTTTVIISHSGWSEPGFVEVSLVLKYTPDVDEESVLNLGSSSSTSTDEDLKTVKQTKNSADNLVHGVVNLCAPVKVCIMPKATR